MEPEARFKIDELAEATDLSRRTIHHYIAQGLIPRARGGAGPAAYYDEEHYLRLRAISRLKEMGLSLLGFRHLVVISSILFFTIIGIAIRNCDAASAGVRMAATMNTTTTA